MRGALRHPQFRLLFWSSLFGDAGYWISFIALQAEMADNLRVDQREREKTHLDAMVRIADIEAKYGTQVNAAHIEALLSRDQEIAKANIDADVRRHAAVMQAMAPPAQGAPNA